MQNKKYETLLVFVIIGIVLCVIMRYITSIIDDALKTSAITQTYTLMTTVEQIYVEATLNGTDELPFAAVFKNGEIYIKVGGKTKLYVGGVTLSKKLPNEGEIVIMVTGNKIIANNIKINNYICNTLKETEVICEKA